MISSGPAEMIRAGAAHAVDVELAPAVSGAVAVLSTMTPPLAARVDRLAEGVRPARVGAEVHHRTVALGGHDDSTAFDVVQDAGQVDRDKRPQSASSLSMN